MGKQGTGTNNARVVIGLRINEHEIVVMAASWSAVGSALRRATAAAPGSVVVLSLLTQGQNHWYPLCDAVKSLPPPPIDVSDGDSVYSFEHDVEILDDVHPFSLADVLEAHEALKKVAYSNIPDYSYIADQLLMMLLELNDGRTIGGAGTGFVVNNFLSRAALSEVVGKIALPEKCVNDIMLFLAALRENRAPTRDELGSAAGVSLEQKFTHKKGYGMGFGSSKALGQTFKERCSEVALLSGVHRGNEHGADFRTAAFLGAPMAKAIDQGRIYALRRKEQHVRVVDDPSDLPPPPLADEEIGALVAVPKTESGSART